MITRILAAFAALTLAAGVATALAQDAPSTTIAGPSGTTNDATPTFTFNTTEPGGTFECRIDGGAWAACASPHTLSALPDGDHVFSVRAIDEAGNADPSPASRSFSVDTSGIETTIDAGPNGLTNDPTPTFGFGTTTTSATFECRIDGAGSPVPAFAECSAPLTLPALGAGAWAFVVRAVSPEGRKDPTPARRTFTVDPVAPETELLDGPGEGQDSPSRTPTFRYRSEAGARFECRVDNGVKNGVDLVDWKPCEATGFTTASLSGGQHTFEVRAVDLAGNVDATPAARTFRVVACERVVRFGLVEATGDCLLDVGTREAPRWESEGDVTINGLPVPAPGPAKVVLTAPEEGGQGGGSIGVSGLTLAVGGVELYRGAVKWDIPAGGIGEEKTVKTFPLGGSGEKLFGLEVGGEAVLRLGRRAGTDDRYAVLGLKVALPSVFQAGPNGGTGGVTGDVAIRMSTREGVQLDGLKVAVGNAYVGGLGVKSLCLSYLRANATAIAACQAPTIGNGKPEPFIQCKSDSTVDRWDGALAIVLPTASGTELGLWGGMAGGKLSHAGAYVDKLGTLVPLAPGVFLEKVALGVCLEPPPFKVKGEAAIAFGPDFKGKRAAVVNGWMQYTDSHGGSPWVIEAGGSLVMFDHQLAEAWVKYQSSGMVDFGFRAGFDFGPASLSGGVAGWTETRRGGRFNVAGHLEVCVDDVACAAANGVISTVGAAGCITVTLASVPVPYWKGPWPTDWAIKYVPVEVTGGAGHTWANGQTSVMVGSCSVGPWEAQRAVARAAQAGPPTFTVENGQPATVIGFKGEGGAPKVVLVGPDGRRIEAPAHGGGAFVKGSHLLSEDEAKAETTVMIAKPAAGRWRVETLPGSPALTDVRQADVRPAPMVAGRVTGRGHQRVLHYAYKPQAGQTLTFVERGKRTQQTLGAAKPGPCRAGAARRAGLRCGLIRFRPGLGGAGERKIEVTVEQGGLPRPGVVAARYTAPADAKPAPPRSLKLRAGRVTWKAAPGAHRVNVIVRTRGGRRLLFIRSPKERTLRVPLDTFKVAARGMRMDGVEGRPATVTVKTAKTKKPTRRKR